MRICFIGDELVAGVGDPRVGFVARLGTGGTRAARRISPRRSRAAARLRRWERCSAVEITS